MERKQSLKVVLVTRRPGMAEADIDVGLEYESKDVVAWKAEVIRSKIKMSTPQNFTPTSSSVLSPLLYTFSLPNILIGNTLKMLCSCSELLLRAAGDHLLETPTLIGWSEKSCKRCGTSCGVVRPSEPVFLSFPA